MKISTISPFKKELFPRKLYAEILVHKNMKDQFNDTQDNLTKNFEIISYQACGSPPKNENEQFFHSESFSFIKMIEKIKYGINN